MTKLSKGLFLDCDEKDQPQGTYRFAKNVVDSNTLGAIENELGFAIVRTLSVLTYGDVVGMIPIGDAVVVFTHFDDNIFDPVDYILLLTQASDKTIGAPTVVYSSEELGFDTDYPIKGEYQINANSERIVAWIDGLNPPRIINIDDPEVNTVDDFTIFSSSINPFWTITLQNAGGTLLSATYIPIIKYSDSNGRESSWIITGDVQRVFDDTISTAVSFDGSAAGTPTAKSILISLTTVDTTYDTIHFGLIEVKNGTTTAYEVQETTTASSLNYTYTGNESRIDLSLEEVLASALQVASAKAITQYNNQLVLGNLTYGEDLDVQAIANKIKINYTTSIIANVAKSIDQNPGFQSGEVYAFYLILELNSGGHVAYHIPGRGPTSTERNNSSFVNGLTAKKFQVEDTSLTGSAVTNMGFWENTGESYNSTFPVGYTWDGSDATLAGQPVRHHRFPDMDSLITRAGGAATLGISSLIKLGISISNVLLSADTIAQIRGWRVAYAKRDYNNSLVLGSDLLHFAYKYTSNAGAVENLQATSGGNFKDTVVGSGTLSSSIHRGHCLDLIQDKPSVIPTYIKFLYKLRKTNLNTSYTNFDGVGATDTNNYQYIINYTTGTTRTTLTVGTRATTLHNYQYLPQDTTVSINAENVTTLNSEECIYGRLNTFDSVNLGYYSETSSTVSSLQTISLVTLSTFQTSGNENDEIQTYLVQYRQAPTNVYNSYLSQTLIISSSRAAAGATSLSTVKGGDTFLTPISYTSYPSVTPLDDTTKFAYIFHNVFIAEARHNWKLRYDDGEPASMFYPHSEPSAFTPGGSLTVRIADEKNKVNFNRDYDTLNEFISTVIVDDPEDFIQAAPTTIIYSSVVSAEGKESGWRFFPVNNRYVQPQNRGPITNLQGFGNRELLIHHRDSLYVTRSRIALGSNVDDIEIKSAELFEIPPEELISSEQGYGGTQHPLGTRLTKLGYMFTDAKQGKVFIYNGKLEEMSSYGLRNFFRDNLSGQTVDNPFNNQGYLINYDEFYNRIILAKLGDSTQSFTVSYNPQDKHWTAFHDYKPRYTFTLNDNSLYYLFNTAGSRVIYRANAGNRGTYFSGTIYPSYVDVISTSSGEVIYSNVIWESRFFNSDNKQLWDQTLSHITCWTQDKCTGKITVVPLTNISLYSSQNTRNYSQVWVYNDIYNLATDTDFLLDFYNNFTVDPTKLNSSSPWYDKRRFIDKYLVYRLEFSNSSNYKCLILDTEVISRPSYR